MQIWSNIFLCGCLSQFVWASVQFFVQLGIKRSWLKHWCLGVRKFKFFSKPWMVSIHFRLVPQRKTYEPKSNLGRKAAAFADSEEETDISFRFSQSPSLVWEILCLGQIFARQCLVSFCDCWDCVWNSTWDCVWNSTCKLVFLCSRSQREFFR